MNLDIYIWITPEPTGIFPVEDAVELADGSDDYENGYTRIDLDSSVQINLINKVKDAKNIKEVYQPITLPFRVPATKTNNRIFRRWSDPNFGTEFDARRKVICVMKLGGMDYRYGHLSLQKVDMENGDPIWYHVRFADSLAALKDIVKDDRLPVLRSLDVYSHEYAPTSGKQNVKVGLEDGLGIAGAIDTTDYSPVIYPFISNNRGFIYNGTDGVYEIETLTTPTLSDRLTYSDLNPAVNARTLLDAIGERYAINFTGDFIDSHEFKSMYLWCNRFEGGIALPPNLEEEYPNIEQVDIPITRHNLASLTLDPNDSAAATAAAPFDVWEQAVTGEADWSRQFDMWRGNEPIVLQTVGTEEDLFIVYDDDNGNKCYYTFNVDISFTGSTTSNYRAWTRVTYRNAFGGGQRVKNYSHGVLSGNYSSGTLNLRYNELGGKSDEVYIVEDIVTTVQKLDGGLQPFDLTYTFTGRRDSDFSYWNGAGGGAEMVRTWNDYEYNVTSSIITRWCDVPYNLPDMPIMDLLRSWFQMFNMAVVPLIVGGTTEVKLAPLPDFYDEGDTLDLTEYVDVSKATVKRISPYNQIDFKYEGHDTYFAKYQDQAVLGRFGDLYWSVGTGTSFIYDGGKYEIELPLEKMLMERMINQNNLANKSHILWGWAVEEDGDDLPKPVETKPLLFYRRPIEPNHVAYPSGGNGLAWNPGFGLSTISKVTTYNAPSNTLIETFPQVGTTYNVVASLNWGEEYDEFGQNQAEIPQHSLFLDYWEPYITSLYALEAKEFDVTATLPQRVVQSLSVNDTVRWRNADFLIEEFRLDPSTGKTKFKLRVKIE